MKILSRTFIVILSCHVLGVSARLKDGNCRDFSAQTEFDPDKYLGRWYEYSKYFAIFESFGTCTNAVYSDVSADDSYRMKIGVHNMGVDRMTGDFTGIRGTAVLSDPDDPSRSANLIVNFDPVPVKQNTTNYSVLRTDYSSFSVVYACEDGPADSERVIEYLWVLTRQQFPEEELITRIYSELEEQGFDTVFLWKTKQTDCPEFPAE